MITKSKLSSTMLALASMFAGSPIGSLIAPRSRRRPTGKALRNPVDPYQAASIQAAADKRARKAKKLDATHGRSNAWNPCRNSRLLQKDFVGVVSNFQVTIDESSPIKLGYGTLHSTVNR